MIKGFVWKKIPITKEYKFNKKIGTQNLIKTKKSKKTQKCFHLLSRFQKK